MIRTTLTAGAVILAAASAQAAPMSPDSFGGLQLWLQAADLNFDGTTWADSSGNGNDAVPQGVGFAATYGAPAAATLTPGAGVFSGQTIKGVEFAANADDLLVAADLNGNSNTGTWTMLSVFDASGVDAAGSETRPIGLGSQAANGSTGGNLLNQATDNSTRYDNGFNTGAIASGSPTDLAIRVTRIDNGTITDWIYYAPSGTPSLVLNIGPTSSTSGGAISSPPNPVATDDFYLGDVRAGFTPVNNPDSLADIFISQAIVYNAALSDSDVAMLVDWVVDNPAGVPEPASMALLALGGLMVVSRRR